MLDLLTDNKSYAQAVAGLDLLTAPNSLDSHLQAFLLSCRVDGLSPATIHNYQYQAGAFVNFCHQLNLTLTAQITPQHIRLFILSLQETNKATSVQDYRKSIIADGLQFHVTKSASRQ